MASIELFCSKPNSCFRCAAFDKLRWHDYTLTDIYAQEMRKDLADRGVETDIIDKQVEEFLRLYKTYGELMSEISSYSSLLCHTFNNALAFQKNRDEDRELFGDKKYEGLKAIVYYTALSNDENIAAIIVKRNATYTQGQWIDEHGNVLHGVTSWALKHE